MIINKILVDIKCILQFFEKIGYEKLPIDIPDSPFTNKIYINKKIALEKLRASIGNCKRCKLSNKRNNIVFGEGNPEASLMFIGEAPGEEEDIKGKPFIGKAGQLLTRLINKMGLNRDLVYITNVVKCRPPNNRKPTEDEIKICSVFLYRQIEIISPIVIMTLGDVATKGILHKVGNITKVRGNVFDYKGIKVVPTFHPSYLLRNPSQKILTWNDAQLVLKILKTRKFF